MTLLSWSKTICNLVLEKKVFFKMFYHSGHLGHVTIPVCTKYGKLIVRSLHRRVAEIQILEKTSRIVIKDETGLKFKINDSTLFLIGSYAQKR